MVHEPINRIGGAPRHRKAIGVLSTARLNGTTSVLHLVGVRRFWDAELVKRSLMEGTVKFAFLLENPASFTARCIEYADALELSSNVGDRRGIRRQWVELAICPRGARKRSSDGIAGGSEPSGGGNRAPGAAGRGSRKNFETWSGR